MVRPAYRDFTDLAKKTTSNKVFQNKIFIISKTQLCDDYQKRHASVVFIF